MKYFPFNKKKKKESSCHESIYVSEGQRRKA